MDTHWYQNPSHSVYNYISKWFSEPNRTSATQAPAFDATTRRTDPDDGHELLGDETAHGSREAEVSDRSFYGVALVRDSPLQNDDAPPFVFESMNGVLIFCRQYKTSQPRWKRFSSREEAQEFSMTPFDYEPEEQTVNKEALPFRAPIPQELVQLRKYIEDGEIDEVRRLIESNPRYIIGGGDNPTILQVGCRYNAFHIAAKANQAEIMKLILDSLRSPSYYRRLYPFDDERSTRDRIAYIVDLYLNMPDKSRKGETALHLATKFGSISAVQFLLEQKECDRNAHNCERQTAEDIICERGGGQAEARRIEEMFEQNFVIPILRSEDGDGTCRVTQPLTVDTLQKFLSSERAKRLTGLAGPMTYARATKMTDDLKEAWSTPENVDLRKRDAEKGLETIVRNIARAHAVPFREEWSFLGCVLDIASYDGLHALNAHLGANTFIHGDSPTKSDYHLWSAFEPVLMETECKDRFPNVQRWIFAMRHFDNSEMKNWRTPKKSLSVPVGSRTDEGANRENLVQNFDRMDEN